MWRKRCGHPRPNGFLHPHLLGNGPRLGLLNGTSGTQRAATFQRSRLRNLKGFAVDAARGFNATRYTVKSAISKSQLAASWKSREQDVLPDIPQKPSPKRRQHTVSTPRHGLLGFPRSNRHGSPNRCFRRRFSQHLRKHRLRPSQRRSEYRAGTLAAFVRATALIHGTGWRWRSWWTFPRAGEQLTLNRVQPQHAV